MNEFPTDFTEEVSLSTLTTPKYPARSFKASRFKMKLRLH